MRAHEDEMVSPRIKAELYVKQAGECCYCGQVMLMVGDMNSVRFAELYSVPRRFVWKRFATVEHLKRKTDGGTGHRDNIALSCSMCNSKRQAVPWNAYKSQRMREPSITKMEASAISNSISGTPETP